jgi:hypothetical protein
MPSTNRLKSFVGVVRVPSVLATANTVWSSHYRHGTAANQLKFKTVKKKEWEAVSLRYKLGSVAPVSVEGPSISTRGPTKPTRELQGTASPEGVWGPEITV